MASDTQDARLLAQRRYLSVADHEAVTLVLEASEAEVAGRGKLDPFGRGRAATVRC